MAVELTGEGVIGDGTFKDSYRKHSSRSWAFRRTLVFGHGVMCATIIMG
jgi:hypothetical protein